MSASSLCSDQGQTNGGMESSIKTVRAEPSLPWEGQQALFCCVTVVSLQFVKGRGGDNLLTAAVCCSVSDLNLCIPGVERSNKAAGACGSRFQTFTSSLKNWCSRVWLLAGKRIFFFFWCKGIRINTWIKNYAQHPLVWKETNLRLAPLPLDVPRAGQLLTPKGGCVPAPSGTSALLPARSTRSGHQRVPL